MVEFNGTTKKSKREIAKEEKEKLKIAERKEKAENEKKLLEDADLSEMTTQQRVWVLTKMYLYAAKPFVMYMIMPAVVIAVGGFLCYGNVKKALDMYTQTANNFYTFIGIVLALFSLWKTAKKRGSTVCEEVTLSFKNVNWEYILIMLAFGFCSAMCVSSLLSLIPDSLMVNYDKYTQSVYNSYDIPLLLVSISILDPIAEEIVFRGYMLNRLLPRLKEKKAVWIVTIIFALCHIDPLWMLIVVGFGYILAKISIRHDNILYSIMLHIGFNIPTSLIYLISTNETANDLLFGNKFLIFMYMIIFGGLTYFLTMLYLRKENLIDIGTGKIVK